MTKKTLKFSLELTYEDSNEISPDIKDIIERTIMNYCSPDHINIDLDDEYFELVADGDIITAEKEEENSVERWVLVRPKQDGSNSLEYYFGSGDIWTWSSVKEDAHLFENFNDCVSAWNRSNADGRFVISTYSGAYLFGSTYPKEQV